MSVRGRPSPPGHLPDPPPVPVGQVQSKLRDRSQTRRSKNRMSPYRWALPFPDRMYPSHLFPCHRLNRRRHVLQANRLHEQLFARAATKLIYRSFYP
jgi:hypothetical protein